MSSPFDHRFRELLLAPAVPTVSWVFDILLVALDRIRPLLIDAALGERRELLIGGLLFV